MNAQGTMTKSPNNNTTNNNAGKIISKLKQQFKFNNMLLGTNLIDILS